MWAACGLQIPAGGQYLPAAARLLNYVRCRLLHARAPGGAAYAMRITVTPNIRAEVKFFPKGRTKHVGIVIRFGMARLKMSGSASCGTRTAALPQAALRPPTCWMACVSGHCFPSCSLFVQSCGPHNGGLCWAAGASNRSGVGAAYLRVPFATACTASSTYANQLEYSTLFCISTWRRVMSAASRVPRSDPGKGAVQRGIAVVCDAPLSVDAPMEDYRK